MSGKGIYLNPGNELFRETVNSEIYVDKTILIDFTNHVLETTQKEICVRRPRRFGKSIVENMLVAYYIAILKIITSDQQQKTILCNQKARL